jgi:hypothetical protein
MPTPFYHLSIAEELLANSRLPEETRRWLIRQRPAFLLGNTAPDVQTVSQQAREATHFFVLPLQRNAHLPWEVMWNEYPELRKDADAALSEAQAAFLAGYVCHLQADWVWVNEIFEPFFGSGGHWAERQHRLYIHNVLRAYLDRQVLGCLHPRSGELLMRAVPEKWLPFVEDAHLCQWRDFLAPQLHPGASAQTVEVFAARQGIDPEQFYQLLDSEPLMDQQVFVHLSRRQMSMYRQQMIAQSLALLSDWQPAHFAPHQTSPRVSLGLMAAKTA